VMGVGGTRVPERVGGGKSSGSYDKSEKAAAL